MDARFFITSHNVASLKVIFLKLILCVAIFSLTSCGYLIKPSIHTGIIHLEPGSYKNDPLHTSVLFKLNHMGMSTFVGRFDKVDTSLEFNPQKMADSKLSAIINIASIDVNNRELEESLRDSDWFDTGKYPQAFFTTTSVQVIDDTSAKFTGNLTLHGVTASIELNVVFNGGGNNMLTGRYTIGFTASTRIKRSQFGIDYLVPAIGDEVSIEVFAEFQQQ